MTAPRPVQLGLLEGADKAVGPILGIRRARQQRRPHHRRRAALPHRLGHLRPRHVVAPTPPRDLVTHDLASTASTSARSPTPTARSTPSASTRPTSPATATATPPCPRPGLPRPVRTRRTTHRAPAARAHQRRPRRMRPRHPPLAARQVPTTTATAGSSTSVTSASSRSRRLGLRCHDLIVHAAGTGPGGGQILVPQRARRAHSYLLVYAPAGGSTTCLTAQEAWMARREYARIGVDMPEEESIKALDVEPQWLYDRLLLRPRSPAAVSSPGSPASSPSSHPTPPTRKIVAG
jgi:hypothetical protein